MRVPGDFHSKWRTGEVISMMRVCNLTRNTLLYKFFYGGAENVAISGNVTPTQTVVFTPILTGGTASPATFADVAPRANMLNVFRTTGNSITVNGQQFLQVDDRLCSSLQTPSAASVAQSITLADLTWGVSNVGTAPITVAFNSRSALTTRCCRLRQRPRQRLHRRNPGLPDYSTTQQHHRDPICSTSPSWMFREPTFH